MKILIVILLLFAPSLSVALTLDELQQSFTVKRLEIVDARLTNLTGLQSNYSRALGRIQQKYQKAGSLDEALLAKKELDLVAANTWPMPPIGDEAPREIVSARKLYIRNHLEFQKEAGLSLVRAAEKMDELLAEKVISFTKAGDLESAKTTRAIQKAIEDDQFLKEARALVQRVGKEGSSAVALRLRRVGDDLEVEVRYDASGKISLQSPVENVVEITGGKKEKGSTAAKTLGEFIGGKEFKVDPYVALAPKFDDRDLGSLHFTALDSDFKKSDSGEVSLKLQVADHPKNIHVSLGDCLPKLSEKGTFRVEIRYFIPKSNQLISGLKFVQPEAGLIPGSLTQKSGEWETFSFEIESKSENPRLLMYFNYREQVKEPQLVGDYVLISHLRVTHQAMSAYLVQKFDRDGGQAAVNLDQDKQTLFALNGELVVVVENE